MLKNKNVYAELKAFIEKANSNKKQYELLKKDLIMVHTALGQGKDVTQLCKVVIGKHSQLKRINSAEGMGHGDPGCILILLVLIILVGADIYIQSRL